MAMKNYTLGRGKLYFSPFLTGTQDPEGFRYIGNSPEFNLSIESENLDHYSSDSGIREKDASIPLEVTRTGSFNCDDIQPENIALFFFGVSSLVTQSSATAQTYNFTAKAGRMFQLGRTAANPSGYRGVTVTNLTAGGTAKTLGTDYTVDSDSGTVLLLDTGTITDGQAIVVTFNVLAKTIKRIVSGSQPVEGALRYIAANPKGDNFDYDLPYTRLTPNGDLALKGDEWQIIPFSLEALKPAASEAIYVNGRPFTP